MSIKYTVPGITGITLSGITAGITQGWVGIKSKLIPLAFLTLFICLVFPLFSEAASFDCRQAKGQVEKLICSDAELSRLDDELARLYRQRREMLADKNEMDAFVARQKEWLSGVRKYCHSVQCLAVGYKTRIEELQAATSAAPP